MAVSREAMAALNSKVTQALNPEMNQEVEAEEVETGAENDLSPIETGGEDNTQGAGTDVSGDGEVLEAEGEEQEEAPEGDTYTPKKLAEAIGWDVTDVYDGIVIPLDNDDEPIPLGQVKDRFQKVSRERDQLKTQLDGQAEALAQAQTGVSAQQQMSMEMVQAVGYMQSIDRMEQETDWKELEEFDPAQAALKRLKFNQARQDVQGQIQQLQQKENEARGQQIAGAAVKMLEMIPTWSDSTVKTADQSTIRNHMKTVGFADNEINSIVDPRTMTLLKELIDLRAQVTAAQGAVKKVRAAPKVLRGAGGRFEKANAQEAKQNLINRAKKTRNKNDQLAAAKAILGRK